jgi:hypothetical protein
VSDYYPEFYLRKRQREQNYRRMTVVTAGFIALLVVGGVLGYFIVNAVTTRGTQPGATPELADKQQQLQVQERLDNAALPADVLASAEPAAPVDLSQVSYSESFPQISVSLEGAAPPDATQVEGETAEGETSAEGTEQPPAVGREPESAAATDPNESAPQPREESAVSRVTPQDEEAQRKAEQQRRQEQAKRLAEKREREKREKEQQRREDEKKAAAVKPKEERKQPEAAKPAGPPSYTYTVYGGTYLSREAAESDKGKLGALGLSGSVIETGGDYLLIVGKVEDQDSAQALNNKLKGSGFGGAFVTRKAK